MIFSEMCKAISVFHVYKFDCTDLDSNKNSELVYEIDRLFFKSLMSKKTTSQNSSLAGSSLSGGELVEEDNEIVIVKKSKKPRSANLKSAQTQDLEFHASIFKDHILPIDIFLLDKNKGVLSLNLSEQWCSYFSESSSNSNINNEILRFLKKNFLILKIKVTDRGMSPLTSYYYFQIYFCIHMKGVSADKYLKQKAYYCDFGSNYSNDIKTKSLVNGLIEHNHFGDIIINESKLSRLNLFYYQTFNNNITSANSGKKQSHSLNTLNENLGKNKNFIIYSSDSNSTKPSTSKAVTTKPSTSTQKPSLNINNVLTSIENEDEDAVFSGSTSIELANQSYIFLFLAYTWYFIL
jgi:hypothetical protein